MFDAGAVEASLTVRTDQFNRDMDAAEARVKRFESNKHEVKLSAVFDSSSLSRARQQFAQLDNQISKDAMSRLRSNPQGSVLGALNALFSPHPVTGAPSAAQAAQQGLLGKVISAPGGGGTAGPVDSRAQSSAASRVLGTAVPSGGTVTERVNVTGAPKDTTTTDRVNVVGGAKDNSITTTDRVNTVGLPTNNAITTQDRVNVTGLPTSGGSVVTQDTVKEKLDPASAAKTENDARASGDRSGTGWASTFAGRLKNLFSRSAADETEKAAGDSGDRSGTRFTVGFGGHLGPFIAGLTKTFGDAGGKGGAAMGTGLLGGIGPGILGISAKMSGIVGLAGSALGALPAVAGVAGVGAGVALVGGIVAVVSKGAVAAVQPAVQAFQKLQNAAPGKAQTAALKAYQQQLAQLAPAQKTLAASLEGMQSAWQDFVKSNTAGVSAILSGGIGLLPGILSSVSGVFQAVVPQMASVFRSLGGLVQGVIGVARTAVPAFAPFVNAILGLVTNILPGIDVVIKATLPFISQFSQILGTLGRDLGSLFATAAPAIGASMQILSGLLGLLGDLLPAVMKIADIFATALAPVFVQFTSVIRTLIPPLVQIGTVIASFAGAVIGDLAAAFGAIATLIAALAPSLAILATTLSSVFTVLENTGVFAVFGDALEGVALPLAKLVNALVTGLAPVLPVLVNAAAQLSVVLVSALSSALSAVLTALTPVIAVLAKGVVAVVDFLQSTGLLLPVMAGLGIAFGPVASGLRAMAAGLSLVAGSSFATVITGMIGSLREFMLATEGVTLAQKAQLAGMLALDAVSPLAWAAVAVAAVAGLVIGVRQLDGANANLMSGLIAQNQAVGYNVDGYRKLAAQLEQVKGSFNPLAQQFVPAVSAAFTQLAQNMQSRLGTLSSTFGVSQTQIEQWASAAGISAEKFAGAGVNVGSLTTAIAGFVNKNALAVTSTASLATNISIFGNDVFSTTTQLDAFNAIWNTLVGNLLTKQQAVTQAQQSFDNLKTSITQNGTASTATAQSFQAYIQQIGSSVSTMLKQGTSISQVNSYLQQQIGNLQSLGPLNHSQQADLNGLIAVQDTLANSTNGLNAQQRTMISQFENSLIPDLQKLHADTPLVTTDISNLTNSIIQTGTNSAATAGDRAALIRDLENAGLSASAAKGFVDNLQGSIKSLSGKVVSVGVVGSGSGTITFAEQNIKNAQTGFLEFHAAGGPIRGAGGPTQDNIPVWASAGEYMMQASAVSKYGLPFMEAVNARKLAAGGPIDISSILSAPDWMGNAMASAAKSAEGTAAQSMLADMQAKIAAMAASVPTVATAGSSGGIIATMMRNMAAARGWTGAEWNALYALEMAEAGFNMTATNPSSGAYGLAQFINGPSEYASYGGNSTTAQGQITGMLSYISQRYGDPIAAEAHEQAYHWYGNGGVIGEPVIGTGMRSGDRYVLGENGSEMVTPVGGRRGGGATVDDLAGKLDEFNANMRRLIDVTSKVPAGVGAHVGGAINGAAHDASFRSRYPRSTP